MLYFAILASLALVTSQEYGPFPCPTADTPLPPDDCLCEYGKCTWSGDPHQTTFDGFHYHFQGATNQVYRYVSSCTSDEEQVPFQVLARHGACPSGNPAVTCTNQVRIKLYNRVGGAYDRTVTINPGFNVVDDTYGSVALYDLVFYAGGNSFYTRPANNRLEFFTRNMCTTDLSTQLTKPDLIVEDLSGGLTTRNMRVQLNEYYLNMTCGLCGYWDGDQENDFRYSDAPLVDPYTDCIEQELPATTVMGAYDSTDWYNVDTFGAAWGDFGNGIRRLVTDQVSNTENPQNDPERRADALNLAMQLFPQQLETPFFLDDCADDGQFDCPEINRNCIRRVCNDLIPVEPDTEPSPCTC